jgi:hypothetical protein
MKYIIKFNEEIFAGHRNKDGKNSEEELSKTIEDIIDSEVFLRDVSYSDGDMEKDPNSIKSAATEIVNMLKKRGII